MGVSEGRWGKRREKKEKIIKNKIKYIYIYNII